MLMLIHGLVPGKLLSNTRVDPGGEDGVDIWLCKPTFSLG